MRRLLVFSMALLAVPCLWGDEDLFTGVEPDKVPADVQRFLTAVKKAVEGGDTADILRLAHNQDMTGAGWVVFRAQLPVLSKEKPVKVKRIEMLPGAGEDALQFKLGAVTYKRAVPATHLIAVTTESVVGELARFELPAAKVADANANSEYWRLLPAAPQLPADSTVRIEEAKARVEAQPDQAYSWVELTYLHGVLGHRVEVEKGAARLAELTKNKPVTYIEVQLGWTFLNLGDLPKALEHFKTGYELAAADGGRYWNAEYAYAAGLYANGQMAEAVKHFDRAAGMGTVLTERKSIEEWLKNDTPREREIVLGLHGVWARTAAPRQVK
jgi:hypothetical protein